MEISVSHRGGRWAFHGLLFLVLLAACSQPARQEATVGAAPPPRKVVVVEREGLIALFPCSKCHDKVDANSMSKEGPKKHGDIKLAHFEGANKCQICHDPSNMDALALLALEPVSFNASHKVCGQCHGEKLRDWQLGAHGKTVGGWMGEAQKLSCTRCHNAHAPGFATVQALPPPPFPVGGISKGGHP